MDGRGADSFDSHIHMLASSLKLHQAPSENLASKSAGHVNKQALRVTSRANQRDMFTNKPYRTVWPSSNTLQSFSSQDIGFSNRVFFYCPNLKFSSLHNQHACFFLFFIIFMSHLPVFNTFRGEMTLP